MAYFDRNMQVFRTIHRLFHSFAQVVERGVENFFSYKNAESGLTNREICGIIVWKKERN
jgi:Holliday junction resolvasome RuvABC endonuclease subunit